MKDIIFDYIKKEKTRQSEHLELIASENYVSENVLTAQGSILTNKYAEGYPGKRYYGGCENVDLVEKEAITRLCTLFDCKFANVQPHSGSQANAAVYAALLEPGDTILGMDLAAGGHLTHGYTINFSGKFYKSFTYGLNPETELIDYEELRNIAREVKPKLIVAGGSAYPRLVDFLKFRSICDEVGAYLMVDMAHFAGMVAAKLIPSPFPDADVVTSTTHKTLRGPRGGIILTNNEELAKKIDKSVFPGQQGGPLMHVIAAKAVAFGEALSREFISYQRQVLNNAKALSDEFIRLGYPVITKGTDTHLILVNVLSKLGITGLDAETKLGQVNITVNKNAIPFDKQKPKYTSGIRLGSPALTSRGMKEPEMTLIARLIDKALTATTEKDLFDIKNQVLKLTKKFPLKARYV